MRQLIHVPILHSPADMGTVKDGLEAAYVERFGRRHWQEHLAMIECFWQAVRADLEQLGLDYRQVDLYQDGLPACGRELDIVREVAGQGSENYQLLRELIDRGATLIGTEDANLLLEEYRSVTAALARKPGRGGAPAPASAPATADRSSRPEDILSRRDAYIGRRIDQTLAPGRTGVLFLGMMHHVEPHLPADLVGRRLVPAAIKREAGLR